MIGSAARQMQERSASIATFVASTMASQNLRSCELWSGRHVPGEIMGMLMEESCTQLIAGRAMKVRGR